MNPIQNPIQESVNENDGNMKDVDLKEPEMIKKDNELIDVEDKNGSNESNPVQESLNEDQDHHKIIPDINLNESNPVQESLNEKTKNEIEKR